MYSCRIETSNHSDDYREYAFLASHALSQLHSCLLQSIMPRVSSIGRQASGNAAEVASAASNSDDLMCLQIGDIYYVCNSDVPQSSISSLNAFVRSYSQSSERPLLEQSDLPITSPSLSHSTMAGTTSGNDFHRYLKMNQHFKQQRQAPLSSSASSTSIALNENNNTTTPNSGATTSPTTDPISDANVSATSVDLSVRAGSEGAAPQTPAAPAGALDDVKMALLASCLRSQQHETKRKKRPKLNSRAAASQQPALHPLTFVPTAPDNVMYSPPDNVALPLNRPPPSQPSSVELRLARESTFFDVPFEVGRSYQYYHGVQKYNFVFTDIHLLNPCSEERVLLAESGKISPLLIAKTRVKTQTLCCVCSVECAMYACFEHRFTPKSPTYMCQTCFVEFNYSTAGDLVFPAFLIQPLYTT